MKVLVLAAALLAQATDPPPLPEATPPPPPPQETAPGAASGNPAIDKYQHCFQKMIDAGSADNAFMRKCLGLEPRTPKKAPPPGERAALTREEVAAVAAKGLPALRDCYDKLLVRTKALGVTPEGTLEARFDVRPDGGVESVAYASASVNDVALLGCVRDRIGEWRFPGTGGSDKLGVRLAVQLALDAKRKAGVSIVKGYPTLSGPALGYAADELLAVFRKYAAGVRKCYEKVLARKPQASGVAAADVTVDARGKVAKVSFRQMTVDDPAFKSCLTGAIRRWRFPRPRGGEEVVAKYPPWTFSPAMVAPPSQTPPP